MRSLEARERLPGRLRVFAPSRPVTRVLQALGLAGCFDVVGPVARPARRGGQPYAAPLRGLGDAGPTSPPRSLPVSIDERATIEQPKGLLMGAHGCDPDAAAELLHAAARADDVHVGVMAKTVVENASGRLPFVSNPTQDDLSEIARSGPEAEPPSWA